MWGEATERIDQNPDLGASLVAQWLKKIHLPMQETWVQSLVQEDLACLRQLSPCTMTIEPVLRNKRSHRDYSVLASTRKVHVAMEGQHSQKEIN